MKSTVMAILATIVLCSVQAFSQTTLEEYNYVTKGYKIQFEGGLDMKKGYRFEEVTQHNTKSAFLGVMRNTTFKALFRDGETKPCALLCVFSKSSVRGTDYICLPNYASSQQVWDLANQKLYSYSGDDAKTLMLGFAIVASYYSSK